MFSSRASLGPTGRTTYSTRETPALSVRERVLIDVQYSILLSPYFFVWVDAPGYDRTTGDACKRRTITPSVCRVERHQTTSYGA